MAMGTERSKALHNFTFPVGLRWGKQRFLRCIKVDSGGQVAPLAQFTANDADLSDHHHQQSINKRRTTSDREMDKEASASKLLLFGSHQMGSTPPQVSDGGRRISEGDDDGFAAMREDVKLDFQTAADKLKGATFKENREDGAVSVSLPPHPPLTQHSTVMPEEGETKKPWNLRKRRASGKTPVSGFVFGTNGGASAAGVCGKDLRADEARGVTDESSRLGSGGNLAAMCGEKSKREKFSVALSKREIGEDFLTFTGHRPARRAKKRARIVQRELDTLFPGLSLTEITADMYKVSEVAP